MQDKKLSLLERWDSLTTRLTPLLTDEDKRARVQYLGVTLLLGVISLLIVILNVATHKGALTTLATLFYAVLSFGNAFLFWRYGKQHVRLLSIVFITQMIGMFIFFIVVGRPDGFPTLWICLLPACGMLLFGMRRGVILCIVMFFILAFFFWLPLGRSMLQYDYSETFMMRFPMFFMASFLLSVLLEYIRFVTQRELDRLREKYSFAASHDYLTSILNRAGFKERYNQAKRSGRQTVMMIDIDHFKYVNDHYGHEIGDLVLTETAQTISDNVKGVVCRWGGEEFVVWVSVPVDGNALGETVRRAVEGHIVRIPGSNRSLSVTISVGVASGPPDSVIDVLVKRADLRMFDAKDNGRNRVVGEPEGGDPM